MYKFISKMSKILKFLEDSQICEICIEYHEKWVSIWERNMLLWTMLKAKILWKMFEGAKGESYLFHCIAKSQYWGWELFRVGLVGQFYWKYRWAKIWAFHEVTGLDCKTHERNHLQIMWQNFPLYIAS